MGDIFNKKIPSSVRILLLSLALFPHLMILGMFNLNATFTASFLDLEADDLQFLFAIAYASIVCTLFVHVRFFQFFNIRSYLLLMTCLSIVLLIGMISSNNTQILFFLRLIQGPITLLEGCILLPVLMSQMKSDYAKIVAYSVLYGYMLTSDKFTLSILQFIIENFTFEYLLFGLIIFHALALLIYLTLFNHNRMFPKKPLYQINIAGMILLLFCLISGAYFLIYGKKYDWFESNQIVLSFISCLVFAVLFVLYQRSIKRPQFHFEILKSKRIIIGLVLFFIFYIMRAAINNLYQVMGQVWQWPWTNILEEQYFNVFGSILGVLISIFLMIKLVPRRYIFGISFLLMSAALLWIRSLMYVDIPVYQVRTPLFLMGLGQGLLFTPLVLFMLGSVHPNFSGNASVLGTAIRFWSSIIGYSIMQNLGLRFTLRQQDSLLSNMDLSNPTFGNTWNNLIQGYLQNYLPDDALNLTASKIQNQVFNQAVLLSNMTIFNALFIIGIMVSVICVFYFPTKKILHKLTLS